VPTAPPPGRILLVDDDPMIVRLVHKILATRGLAPVEHAASGREALARLDGGGIAVVLLDHQLPDTTGLDVLDAIRARPDPPAVVMITAHGNESLAAGVLRRGADDYLAKDASLTEMLPQVLERVRRVRELRKALAASERDLLRAERLAAIGEMTVTLHHEINNPLMAAFAEVELLLENPAMPEPRRLEGLREIQTALRRIRDIVRRIGELREVRTRHYASGLRMVDLDSPADAAPAPSLGRAVVLLADEDLTRVVSLLLRHAGFEVEAAADPAELQARIEAVGARLVVVRGGTGAAGAHPLGGFRPTEDRGYRLVALVAGDGEPARSAGADLVVSLPFAPGVLAADLVDLSTRGG
jgi:DNA-binding response OmpR family regulator